jgi:hypothetical protein
VRVIDLLHNGQYDDLLSTSISNTEMSIDGEDIINADEIMINRTVMIEKIH